MQMLMLYLLIFLYRNYNMIRQPHWIKHFCYG
ncbi:unnamed protein product [Trichobilharzia regenti]|nr:unnamed protein product [Trichobilharzia regenti]